MNAAAPTKTAKLCLLMDPNKPCYSWESVYPDIHPQSVYSLICSMLYSDFGPPLQKNLASVIVQT